MNLEAAASFAREWVNENQDNYVDVDGFGPFAEAYKAKAELPKLTKAELVALFDSAVEELERGQ